MTEPNKTPDTSTAKQAMSAAAAAKLVKRPVLVPPKEKDGQPTVDLVAVKVTEVLAFKDYGSHVVVVTNDGQKFSSADAS